LAHTRALSALVVGLCLEHWGDQQDEQSGLGRQELLSMIETRVGLSTFTAALESLERLIVHGCVEGRSGRSVVGVLCECLHS
jgi:hypothetical protein